MSLDDDRSLVEALQHFDLRTDALLGIGSEACVFARDANEVLRVHHPGTTRASVDGRAALLEELHLSAPAVAFELPRVLETRRLHGRFVTREPRLPGRPLAQALGDTTGSARADLLLAFLECTTTLSALRVTRPYYGDLSDGDPVRRPTYRAYLAARAAKSLALAGPGFETVDPGALASAVPEPSAPSFVHLDLYPGNVLVDGTTVTAVVDFGGLPIVGDARLDSLAAVAYLTPNISRTANDADRQLALQWLDQKGWLPLFDPVQRWVAARWSFARDDVATHAWCRATLLA